MTETQPPIRRGRGRRPAAEVREQVLAAAGELLLAEGMAGFTIEKVAARAGASRMTIYKWWPSRGALALDGYATKVRTVLEFPDTGDIEADLRAQLHTFMRVIRDSPAGLGYLLKDRVNNVATLHDAMSRVVRGESVIDPEIVRTLVTRPRQQNPLDRLTERERDVLALMAEGRSNYGIGDRLHLSPKTVEAHVGAIMTKLDLADTADDNRRVAAVVRYLRG